MIKNNWLAAIGVYGLGYNAYNRPLQILSYDLSVISPDIETIDIYTPSGYLLERFFINSPSSIFSSYEFVNDWDGCNTFKFTLSELPKISILRFSKVVYRRGLDVLFTGYVDKIPMQGQEKLEFSGYGMRKRLEKVLIINPYADNSIDSIEQADTVTTINFSSNMYSIDIVGLKVVARDCDDEKNNTSPNSYFTITETGGVDGAWWLKYTNAKGQNQSIRKGFIDILPYEWSNIGLKSTIIDYCIQHLSSNPVLYNPFLIEETTGYNSGGTVNFHGMEFSKFLEEMRKSLPNNFRVGVNEDGYFFIENVSTTIIDKFFEQYDFSSDSELQESLDKVYNSISVMRQDSGGKKWQVAAISTDQTSIALYGELSQKLDIPYAIEDAAAQDIADIYLANNKDPKYSIQLKKQKYEPKTFSYYGIVTKANRYNFIIDQFDNFTGWSTGANITRSIGTNEFISGAGCHVLTFGSSAEGETHILTMPTKFNAIGLQYVGLYLYVSNITFTIEFGYGENAWDENIIELSLTSSGFFLPYSFIASSLREIGFLGFRFSNIYSNYQVKIDNCFGLIYSNVHYEMNLNKQRFVSSGGDKYIDLDFGMAEKNDLAGFISFTKDSISNNTLMIRS